MARMSNNDKCPSGIFGDSSQLTNWILDYVATCHMTPEISDFTPGSLEDTDKHIEVADVHHVTAGGKVQVQIKMCNDHINPFIATLHNVLLAPYLCDRFFSIVTLMNSGQTCLFHKGFSLYTSEQKIKMQLHYHIVHKGNMHFGGKARKCQRQINYHLEIKLL